MLIENTEKILKEIQALRSEHGELLTELKGRRKRRGPDEQDEAPDPVPTFPEAVTDLLIDEGLTIPDLHRLLQLAGYKWHESTVRRYLDLDDPRHPREKDVPKAIVAVIKKLPIDDDNHSERRERQSRTVMLAWKEAERANRRRK